MPIEKRLSRARAGRHRVFGAGGLKLGEIEILLSFTSFAVDGYIAELSDSQEREFVCVLHKGATPKDVVIGLRSLATLIENEGV